MSELPPGFVLEQPSNDLPPGFVLEQPSSFMGALKDFAGGIARAGLSAGPAQFGTMSPAESADLAPSGVPVQRAAAAIPPTQNRYIGAAGEAVGNPATWLGPGSLALKTAAGIGGALGSEAGGQATQGTPYETFGRLGGALLGGGLAAGTLGPKPPQAAIPTYSELRPIYKQGYKNAINSGLEITPNGLGQFATAAGHELSTDPELAFTGRSAPRTFALLSDMGTPPTATDAATKVTTSNIRQISKDINSIASEVQPTETPGVYKPTPDAAAAMALKERWNKYLENIPDNHIVGGDPNAFRDAVRQANGDFSAAQKIGAVDYRIAKATNANARALTGSLGDRLQANIGRMLDSPKALRGYPQEAIDQIQAINNGSPAESTLRQAGRLSNYSPLQIAYAIGSGGAYIPYQIAAGLLSSAAKHTSDSIVSKQVDKLVETLAKTSPEYARRVKNLPADTVSGKAAIVRALLNTH